MKNVVFHCEGRLQEDTFEDGAALPAGAPRHFRQKLEENITAKQEAEAKVASLEAKVRQYEAQLGIIKDTVCRHVSSVTCVIKEKLLRLGK